MAHLTDVELVQLMDGELTDAALSAHLQRCEECLDRRARFERASSEIALTIRQRERKSTALAAMGVAAAAAVVVAGVWLTTERAQAGPLPNSRLTPGAARLISRQQVCTSAPELDDRQVPVELAARVFTEYRINSPKPRSYEVDYLITPALGGANDIRNLWPQPYTDGVWTSRVKDALEDHLQGLVCQGKLDLSVAQAEIARDWIAAYRKYFRTSKPLPAHSEFIKDKPWE